MELRSNFTVASSHRILWQYSTTGIDDIRAHPIPVKETDGIDILLGTRLL